MNILIADSGATKSDWVLLGEGSPQFIQTEGLNPHLVSASDFLNILTRELKPNLAGNAIGEIRFFGSGCGSPQKKKEVSAFLQEVFEFAEITVQTDLDAAGLALFGDRAGMVCILGTGSSAGFYEHGEIAAQMPSVGYPHGDEGSGTDIGKRIMMAYLQDELPKKLVEFLESELPVSMDDIFERIQTSKEAKIFLSEVCKAMSSKSRHSKMQQIIYDGFSDFLDKVVETFPEKSSTLELGFVGSVASVYEGELRACAKQKGLEIASVVRSPIEHIALHFSKK
ncbi:MAG: hypothetical protein CL666_14805 [Balneola sp.]|nr:hypothetical protein [Balneola sp.]|tara:strand:- start:34400 stop:35245 length:846 start_codon:yes stop_codon:yes gene_type:complete